ncbi:hypothetical protein A3H10_04290 [Candidatus Uhrbacteria bacterium RIFCSPLOWO2_12_FULL_46_10]|uniref:Uncharacterized protein n=1 Tax=Candidatus Uhrbacteria bacterium RIFCSPLOWO2_01_FULL_47_25 TaxID=1802402 RepID=A0A1F7USG2_9BACT|nr:MAG: hypothetical protein A2752_00445 [Candidatus Uhrbacteria bacterium RIFCSPHIGHO2_01_FULL_46_23]OGL69918.1 MAG: hypothetical protein A3D60_00045 [Candidatus Uhrbacteria bacterium RIFCSPHIGHO2_02_FULL_47_29]OGL75758.1 MAG: hypothetical protein A3E96_00020 [Candidatus Uhrbacteria bacterium RIFCSPHIGHO2_12_FULL_46_13]OGL81243.1 MAG: hypothetical protein A2936_03015 [Candidatus Uhrbacteria bacterium RIFCSPLOWO2_01_FULL_47_25]OGL86020.1 MAG: hypothetical protein A3I37_01355 [Candidatus Uhrbact
MSGHSKEWYLELAFKKAHRWLRRGRLSNNEAVFVRVEVRWLDGSRGAVRCLKGMEKKTRRACSNFMPDDVMRCGPLTKRFKDKGLPAVYIPSEPVSVSAAM